MLFLVQAVNDPRQAGQRRAARAAHLEFIRGSSSITFGAAATSLDGDNVGPVLMVNLPDVEAIDDFVKRDPYYAYYESVRILKLAVRVPEPTPGYFDEKIAQAHADVEAP